MPSERPRAANVQLTHTLLTQCTCKQSKTRVQGNQAKAMMLALQGALGGDELQRGLLQWCQLVCAWLLQAASGTTPQAARLPLAGEPPHAVAALPEYLLLDMAKILTHLHTLNALQTHSRDATHLDDVMLACTALISTDSYVQNPYTRYQLAEAMHALAPVSHTSRQLRRCAWPSHVQRCTRLHENMLGSDWCNIK